MTVTSISLAQTSLISSEFIFPTACKRICLKYSTAILNSTCLHWTYCLQTCILSCIPSLREWPHSATHIRVPKGGPFSSLISSQPPSPVCSFLAFLVLLLAISHPDFLQQGPELPSCLQYQTFYLFLLQRSVHTDNTYLKPIIRFLFAYG